MWPARPLCGAVASDPTNPFSGRGVWSAGTTRTFAPGVWEPRTRQDAFASMHRSRETQTTWMIVKRRHVVVALAWRKMETVSCRARVFEEPLKKALQILPNDEMRRASVTTVQHTWMAIHLHGGDLLQQVTNLRRSPNARGKRNVT